MESNVITSWSLDGGSGKTTVAVNIAAALAPHAKTLLIDFNRYNPRVAVYFEHEENKGLRPLLEESSLDLSTLHEHVVRVNDLDILFGIDDIFYAREITKEQAGRIIEIARSYYDFIIIDTIPNPEDLLTFVALTQSDRIVYVFQNYPGLIGLKDGFSLLKKMAVSLEENIIVHNHANRDSLLERVNIVEAVKFDDEPSARNIVSIKYSIAVARASSLSALAFSGRSKELLPFRENIKQITNIIRSGTYVKEKPGTSYLRILKKRGG